MAEVKTYEDGWDCEPKLQEAVNEIDKVIILYMRLKIVYVHLN